MKVGGTVNYPYLFIKQLLENYVYITEKTKQLVGTQMQA